MTLTGTNGDVIFDTLDSVDGTSARTITLTGVLDGPGGLLKQGAGNLVLNNAAGTFTGTAQVEGGILFVNSGAAATATVKAVAGGTVQPGTLAAAGTGTVATLDLDGGTAAFRIGTSTDLLIAPTFTVTSASLISVIPDNVLTAPSSFTVIDYTGTIGGLGVSSGLTFASSNPHLSGTLEDDTTNTVLKVNITAADYVIWKGNLDGNWNVNATSNWVLGSDGTTPSNFYEFDVVKFDNGGLATNPSVTLVDTITPATLAVENTTGTYTFQGTGIIGGTGLTKSNDGSLVLLNDNTYSGTTTITGGTVTVGNGGTIGTLGGTGNITLSNATLAFNRSDAQILGRTIVGTGGTLIKDGANTLTMNAANNTCDIVINKGTLAARAGGWTTSFAANRTITVNAPGILDTTTHALGGLGGATRPNNIILNEDAVWKLNAEQQLPNTALTMTAAIVNGPGDVRGGGTITTVAHDTKSSVINAPMSTGNGPITFNVADGAVPIDLSVTGNIGGGYGITKSGLGTLVLSGTANTYAGDTAVTAGTLSIGSAYLADAADVLISTGATLDLTTGTTDTIDELKLDGIAQEAGVYGALLSGAQFEVSYITGSGTLTVTTGPAGYAGWAAINAPGQTVGQDYDNDGVSNGVEWVLGGTKDTNDLDKLPDVSTPGGDLVFTFLRDQNSETPDTALSIQVGTNLVDWPNTYPVPNEPGVYDPVTVVDNGSGFDIITLTIPQALDAKKFARLNVTISP